VPKCFQKKLQKSSNSQQSNLGPGKKFWRNILASILKKVECAETLEMELLHEWIDGKVAAEL
jgi:hypothetical protein